MTTYESSIYSFMGVLSGRVNVHLVKQIDMFGLCVVSMKTHPFGNE